MFALDFNVVFPDTTCENRNEKRSPENDESKGDGNGSSPLAIYLPLLALFYFCLHL